MSDARTTQSPSKCSAIVLTLNEQDNLPRCLASLRWCLEVIVVDSGSRDQTKELAATLGARVFHHRADGPFNIAEQRNWALRETQVQGAWVIFIDADEVIPENLARRLETIAADPTPTYDAYELTPRYIFWGRWLKRTQGYPNWHGRFVRVGHAHFVGGVWEHFAPGARVGRLHLPYDHYANSKGFSDWLARHDRYSTWDAQKIANFLENPNRPEALDTQRKLRLRVLAARFWPLRPIIRFFVMYIVRLGFLEGIQALVFCLLYAWYEFMTVVEIAEIRRIRSGRSL